MSTSAITGLHSLKVLVVEDSEKDFFVIRRALENAGLSVVSLRVDAVDAILDALRDHPWDIVLCDNSLPGVDPAVVLDLVSEWTSHTPVVIVTGTVGEEAVADFMQRGIADVVLKDRLVPRLGAVVLREVARARNQLESESHRRLREAVLATFNAADDWREAVENSLGLIGNHFSAALTIMWEAHGPDAILQPIASWAVPEFRQLDNLLNTMRVPAGKTIVGMSILRGGIMAIPRLAERLGTMVAAETAELGIDSIACHSLSAGGRRFGLEMLFSSVRTDLDDIIAELAKLSASLQPLLVRRLIEHDRKLFRDALNGVRNGVLITEAEPIDLPGPRIVYANSAMATMSGYDEHDMLGSTPRILQGPDTNKDKLNTVRHALETGDAISVELENYRRDGTKLLVDVDITPVRDQDRITHFVSVHTDITERRAAEKLQQARESEFRASQIKAEAELREAKYRAENAEAMLRDAIDSISDGLVIYDSDDFFVMCNEAYRQMYSDRSECLVAGRTFEEFLRYGLSRQHLGRIPLEITTEWADELLRKRQTGTGTIEYQMNNGNWIRATDRRMKNGGLAGLRVDITAQKRTQAALIESEERFEKAQEIAGIGSWELDLASGRFIWSKELYRIRGLSPETFEPTFENIKPYTHPDDYAANVHRNARHREGTAVDACDMRIIRPDGEIRIVRSVGQAVTDADGVIRRIVGTAQDVTERRHIERQLVQAQKMEAIGNLTGGMAHDFNNMLGIIMINLDLLKMEVRADEIASELCDEALDGANRCAEVVRRLLAFARRQSLHPEPTDVNKWITEVTRLLRHTLGESVILTLNLEPTLWPAMVDSVQLEATLVNLATNARDAMPRGGKLDISTANKYLDGSFAELNPDVRAGEYCLIEISDSGTGMPPEIMGRIFEPFFTTKGPGKGTGLGLSMAYGFVRQSGGHISVYSEQGLGTTFRLYLPRCRLGNETQEIRTTTAETFKGNEIVLLVEDNMQLRRAATRQLMELGYRVREAADADSAMLILAGSDSVDLLFTDVVMPGRMDGLDLARQAIKLRRGIKVLLTSGFSGARTAAPRDVSDLFPLLVKPYTRAQMARAMRDVLNNILEEPTDETHTIGDIDETEFGKGI